MSQKSEFNIFFIIVTLLLSYLVVLLLGSCIFAIFTGEISEAQSKFSGNIIYHNINEDPNSFYRTLIWKVLIGGFFSYILYLLIVNPKEKTKNIHSHPHNN